MIKATEATHSFTKPKRKTLLGLRRVALLEIILMLGALLLVDYFGFERTRFWDANPHPFWFVVLLLAAQYGTKEGLVAAIASSAALLIGNMPEQAMSQDGYAYTMMVLKLPLMWLVAAVIFGELRQMHVRERADLEDALVLSEEREHSIAQSYHWIKQLKDQLELRMAGQLRSSISAYHAARSMESLSPTDVLGGLEELVSVSLHPEQFSVYALSSKGLDATLIHGWKEEDGYARHFDPANAIYHAVIGQREVLCVANSDHERTLGGQGMLAGPLYDGESGEIVGMLKIEKLGFTDLHLSTIEAFGTICEWAGMAIVNARKYQSAKSGSMVNPDHNLLTYGYFKRYSDYIASLAERVGFDVSMISVRLVGAEQLDTETRARLARVLADAVDAVLRNVDLAFDHQDTAEAFSIVLPATSRKGADIVLKKLRSELETRAGKITRRAEFSFTSQTVYEKRAA